MKANYRRLYSRKVLLLMFSGAHSGERDIGIRWKNADGSYTIGVFDGGTADYGETLKEHMKKYYFNGKDNGHIDFVICSHPHSDHATGLATILENFDVGKLYMNCPWDYVDELYERVEDGRCVHYSLTKRINPSYNAPTAERLFTSANAQQVTAP